MRSSNMIDICMALDQSVSPHTGVRTIQNTGVFWQAVFQPPRPYSLFFGTRRRQNFLKFWHPHNTASYAGYFKCNLKCYESKNFSVPSLQRIFSKKNSLTCGVKCDKFNLRKS